MKILNLYAGIGGNRKLWRNEHDITAVEYNEKIANKYKSLFPNDTVIVADAHEYLLDHYKEFDFIWSSPPCPTHSVVNHFLKGKFCVENVKSYYEPIFNPKEIGRHYLWSNFNITKIKQPKDDIGTMIKGHPNRANKKPLEERNAVNSELGLHILNQALGIIKENEVEQNKLF